MIGGMNAQLIKAMAAACAALAASGVYGQAAERSGEQIVKGQCMKCHAAGTSGAPKIDDRAAWSQRMKNGLDATVRSAMKGHGAMPARGGLANLSDTELRSAILYMFYPAGALLKAAPAAAPAPADPRHKSVDGMDVYIGIAPAETAPGTQPRPSGKGYYYVTITLRDDKTKADIKNAQVEASAANPVTGGETKNLDLITANDRASYGNYFRMQGQEPYTITVQIRRPDSARRTQARFDFKP